MAEKFLVVCGGSGEYLLGQRRILGVRGELQVDVSGEISDTSARIGRAKLDPNSVTVNADAGGANVKQLFEKIGEIGTARNWSAQVRAHADFVAENWVENNSTTDGLAQSPAIGGLAILHPDAQLELERGIKTLVAGLAPRSDVEFWVVASSAGGTGAGIHRHVAEKIIEVVRTKSPKDFKIKFIIIGPTTYQTIAAERANVITFLGLAADAMFSDEVSSVHSGSAPTVYWYYVDVPDFGYGDNSKEPRGSVIALVCKALMLDELTRDLDQSKSNINNVLFRAGYWGNAFNPNELSAAAIKGFLGKIKDFSAPEEQVLMRPGMEPIFKANDGLDRILALVADNAHLVDWVESQKKITASIPAAFDELESYLRARENEFAKFIDQAEFSYTGLKQPPQYVVTPPDFPTDGVPRPFESNRETGAIGTHQWFSDVRNAQTLDAWCRTMLGIRRTVEDPKIKSTRSWYVEKIGLLGKLFEANKTCAKAWSWSIASNSEKIAASLEGELQKYALLLVQVRILFDQFLNARELLEKEFAVLKRVEDFAKTELAKLGSRPGDGAAIVVAELSEELDRLNNLTWLRLASDEVDRNRPDLFLKIMENGAVGLKENGLKVVLGLGAEATQPTIREELDNNVGRMWIADRNNPGTNQEAKAIWFSGQDPGNRAVQVLRYRLLPRLDPTFRLNTSGASVDYKFPPIGILGLRVLALEGMTIALQNDAFTTHAFLIEPYSRTIATLLAQPSWKSHNRGKPGSKLDIATLGVIGDPLSEEVLLQAKLSPNLISELRTLLNTKTMKRQQMSTTNQPIPSS